MQNSQTFQINDKNVICCTSIKLIFKSRVLRHNERFASADEIVSPLYYFIDSGFTQAIAGYVFLRTM